MCTALSINLCMKMHRSFHLLLLCLGIPVSRQISLACLLRALIPRGSESLTLLFSRYAGNQTARGLVPTCARNSEQLRETDIHHFCPFSHIFSELSHSSLRAAHLSLPLAFLTLLRSFACVRAAGCLMPVLQPACRILCH